MMSMRSLAVAAIGTLFMATACSDERSITTEHVGALGFGINLVKQSTNIASGTIRFPLSPLPGTTAASDSVRIRVIGIDSLVTGTYTVWFANDSATKFSLVTSGNLVVTQTDTSTNSAGDKIATVSTTTRAGISGWRAGGQNKQLVFNTNRAAGGLLPTDSLNVVLVSIETGAPGAAPSENRILWARRSERFALVAAVAGPPPIPAFQPESAQIRFGNYKARLAEQFVFTQNSAMAITPRGRLEVRGSTFVLNDSNYYRPPIGYYYAAYLLKQDSLNTVTDTIYMGRRTTPYPAYISLYNADKTNPDPQNVFDIPPVIYAMGVRISGDTIAKAKTGGANVFFRDFAVINVTLESRFAIEGRMGPAIVMTQLLPASVRGR